jgi:GDP-L-fucose synthase
MLTQGKPRVLITGAGGFAGRNLTEHLSSQGYTVYAQRRQDADLLNSGSVERYLSSIDFEVVIHCAVVGGTRKTAYDQQATDVVEANLRMFHNIERCLKPGQRMIHFGSGAEYDRTHYQPKMSEDFFGLYVPADAYGFSKYAISRLIAYRPEITCLRIFGLYGKYEDYRYKFISNAIVKNLLGLPIVINQNVVFDYLYIEDFVRLVERFVDNPPRESFINITPSQSIELAEIAGIINEVGDHRSDVVILNDGMNTEYSGANDRLLRELPDFRFLSYCEGISRLYRYYRSVLDTLDTEVIRQDPFLQYCKTNAKGD